MTNIKKIPETPEKQDTSIGSVSLGERTHDTKVNEKAPKASYPLLYFNKRGKAETLLKLIADCYTRGTMHFERRKVQSYHCSLETWVIKSAYYPGTKNKYWFIHYDNALDNLPF